MKQVRVEIHDDKTEETNLLFLTFREFSALVGAYHVIVMLTHADGVGIVGGDADTIQNTLNAITRVVPDLDNLGNRLWAYGYDRGWTDETC